MRAAFALVSALALLSCTEHTVTHESSIAERDWVSAEEYPTLLDVANAGDWRAAKRLGLHRFFNLDAPESSGEETERLYRIWASGDPTANAALAHLLAMRCSVEDRREAIRLIEGMLDEEVAIPGDPGSESLRRNLAEYRRDLQSEEPQGCVPS